MYRHLVIFLALIHTFIYWQLMAALVKAASFMRQALTLMQKVSNPSLDTRYLSMLKKKGLITDRVIGLILSWRHTGFNVYCTERIYPRDTKSMENIARYIIRASFSVERLNYIRDDSLGYI